MSVLPRALTLAPRSLPEPEQRPGREIAWAVDRTYWLSRCQGVSAEEGDQYAGEVDGIEYGTRIDVPDFIVLRRGRFPHRTERVSVDEVVGIIPSERLLVLRRRSS